MSHYPQVETDELPVEMDPYQVLHLLPSAPHDLIVEVYWHVVHQLQAANREDPSLRAMLDHVNDAYAAVVDPEARAAYEADRAGSPEAVDGANGAGTRTGVLRRLWNREPVRSSPQRSPWQILHIHPTAPADVVELAYRFWRLSLRSHLGQSAAPELEKLQEAHQILRSRGSEPPAESGLEADPDAAMADTMAGETADLAGTEPVTDAATVDEPGAKGASDRSSARRWHLGVGPLSRIGRWAGTVGGAVWERLRGSSNSSARDPTPWFPVGAPEPTGEDMDASWVLTRPAPHVNAEDRSIAFGVVSEESPDPQLAESVVTEHVMKTRADEAMPRKASDQPPPEAHLTAPGSSETILPTQPSQLAQPSEASAYLVAEAGSARGVQAAIGSGPLSIGSDPTCDVVLTKATPDGKNVAARIWRQDDRFMFHGIGRSPAVLVNGQALVWALLEDGDELQIGDDVFRFQRTVPQREEVRTQGE